jgi:hypothetical protein
MSSKSRTDEQKAYWLRVKNDPEALERHRANVRRSHQKHQYTKKRWERIRSDPQLYEEYLRKRREYAAWSSPKQRQRQTERAKERWSKIKADPLSRERKNARRREDYSKFVPTPEQVARTRETSRKWAANNREHLSRLNWLGSIKRAYGITSEQYDAMWRKQDGRCAICGEPERARRLGVDHCHVTGRVRGLLCRNCNSGLGHFRDRPSFISSAIQYLSSTPAAMYGAGVPSGSKGGVLECGATTQGVPLHRIDGERGAPEVGQ